MPGDYSTTLGEHLNCNFVLCASLYFRLLVIDARAQDPRFFAWHGALHDTARKLCALAEPNTNRIDVASQLRAGATDLIHGLRDTADLAERHVDTTLAEEIEAYADHIEAETNL
ncbi:hypothetical protein [Pseudaestuariivita rosea]|uniref:hypothetical protein n=1 Tax=Pseudaestuariivita rosea TaxID=2763263 RepID=UPI001ABA68C7|nr:hypothetical protein [Pseudaestuariivita rosea]